MVSQSGKRDSLSNSHLDGTLGQQVGAGSVCTLLAEMSAVGRGSQERGDRGPVSALGASNSGSQWGGTAPSETVGNVCGGYWL